MPVAEMLSRMSSRELTEWAAFLAVEADEADTRRLIAKTEGRRR